MNTLFRSRQLEFFTNFPRNNFLIWCIIQNENNDNSCREREKKKAVDLRKVHSRVECNAALLLLLLFFFICLVFYLATAGHTMSCLNAPHEPYIGMKFDNAFSSAIRIISHIHTFPYHKCTFILCGLLLFFFRLYMCDWMVFKIWF